MKKQNKKLGRPSNDFKDKVTLSIEKEILKNIRKYAEDKKKPLSQLTQELYESLLNDEKYFQENPEELKMKIEMALPLIEEMIKKRGGK